MTEKLREYLLSRQTFLAEKAVELQYARQPGIWKPYGHPGYEKSVRDAGYHLVYLAEAAGADDSELFSEYLTWVKILFANLHFPEHVLPTTLECLRQVLAQFILEDDLRAEVIDLLDSSTRNLAIAPTAQPGYLEGDEHTDRLARQFMTHLLDGDRRSASELILSAVKAGLPIKEVYLNVFQRTQREIGRLWQTNQITVAREHFCTAATQMVMSQLYPYIFTGERKQRRMVVACVGGELHEIGARMVADFFEMEGWDTYFLGANTPPESVLAAVTERRAHVLALSATMTFHVGKVREIITKLRAGPDPLTRVMVGGYPFNLSYYLWRRVGADGYAPNAQAALAEAERMLAQ